MIMKNITTIFKSIAILALLLICSNIYSQEIDFNKGLLKNWSVNLHVGNTQYFGDISNGSNPFSLLEYNTAWAYGLGVSKQISPVFGIRSQFIKGRFKGRKDNYSNRAPANLKFSADYFELNLNTTIDLFNLIMKYNSERRINLYGVFGLGLSHFQGESVNYKTNKLIRSFGNGMGNGLSGWQVEGMMYGGGGLKLRISKSFDAFGEITLKSIANDDLDGIVGGFKFDMFSYNCIGIAYNFGNASGKKKVIFEEPKIQDIEPVKEADPAVVEVVKEEPKVIEPPVTNVEQKTEPVIIEKPEPTPQPIVAKPITKEFKVQVMASKTKVDTKSIQKKFAITDDIREDYDGNWYRYSVGSQQELWKAKEDAKKLISKNKVYGAFVVGFKDGKRLNSYKELLNATEKEEMDNSLTEISKSVSAVGVFYRVQIVALSKKMKNEADFKLKYKIDQEIFEEMINNLYIYTTGNETEFSKIVVEKNKLRENGIKDAFIVTYKNNKRVSINSLQE